MEANSVRFTHLPLSVLRFMEIESYSYTDPSEESPNRGWLVMEDWTGDLLLWKLRTSQLSHDCS